MKSTVIELVPTALGVQVHVAEWLDPDPLVAMFEQPEIVVPPLLKVTLPDEFVEAVIVFEAK